RKESEDKSRRIKSQRLQQAQLGKGSWGGTRAYGFNRDRTHVPEEAAIIREAAKRILAGVTLRSVCIDLTARGVTTVSGKPWSTTVLRTMLTSGKISGQVEHLGEIMGPGDWEGIISVS